MDLYQQIGLLNPSFPALSRAIEENGLSTVYLLGLAFDDARESICSQLAKRLARSSREIDEFLDALKIEASKSGQNFTEHIYEKRFIKTNLPTLDKQLGGGFPLGEVSEIFGASGCGKSQFLLHLATSCQQIPSRPKCIYISTESPIETRRLKGDKSLVQCVYCPDLESQDHIIQTQLPLILKSQGHEISLIVIDSISHHLRREDALSNISYLQQKIKEQEMKLCEIPQYTPIREALEKQHKTFFKSSVSYKNVIARSLYVMELYQSLSSMARQYNTAIIVSNQVSDKPETVVNTSRESPLDYEHQLGFFSGWDTSTINSHLGLNSSENYRSELIYNEFMNSLNKKQKISTEGVPTEDPREKRNLTSQQHILLEQLHLSANCTTKKHLPALGYVWSRRINTRLLLMKTYRPLIQSKSTLEPESGISFDDMMAKLVRTPTLSQFVDGWSVERFARIVYAIHAPPKTEFYVDKIPFDINEDGLNEF